MKRKNMFKKAFTLVEMLIVVIIIGILIAALLPKLTGAQASARDTARKANLSQISTALMQYFNAEGEYPNGISKTCVSDLKDDLKQYITNLPKDPQTKRITYGTKTNGCTGGVYAYSDLKANGGESAGYVLVANTERFDQNMNYVLTGENVYFTGDLDVMDEKEKVCERGVQMTGSKVTSGCGSSKKRGDLYEGYVNYGIYTIISN